MDFGLKGNEEEVDEVVEEEEDEEVEEKEVVEEDEEEEEGGDNKEGSKEVDFVNRGFMDLGRRCNEASFNEVAMRLAINSCWRGDSLLYRWRCCSNHSDSALTAAAPMLRNCLQRKYSSIHTSSASSLLMVLSLDISIRLLLRSAEEGDDDDDEDEDNDDEGTRGWSLVELVFFSAPISSAFRKKSSMDSNRLL